MLPIDFDPAKDRRNRSLPDRLGISLGDVETLDWATAFIVEDPGNVRHGERRMQAIGFIGARLHVCIFVDRPEDAPTVRRVISLRKANAGEARKYHAQRQQ